MYPGAYLESQPNKPAIIMSSTGEVMTYAELDAGANRLSRLLREAGVSPGDHVAICLENHYRFMEVVWGCHYAGAVYTTCSSRLTTNELAYILNDSGAKVFITSFHMASQASQVVSETPNVMLRLMLDGVIDGYEPYESSLGRFPNRALPDRIAGSEMLYSSGTTGLPKGVAGPFLNNALETTPTVGVERVQRLYGVDTNSTYLSPAPLYHAAPLRHCRSMIGAGATIVVMDQFDAEQFLATVERYQVSHTQVVPTMFVRMLKLDASSRSAYDVSSLRCIIHAAAPCPVPIKRQIIEWFGPIVYEFYGGTEGIGAVFCNSEEWLAHPGTVGVPPPDLVLHIVGEDGAEVPQGEIGAIYFSGGSTFEYHNDPEKTRAAYHPLGWSTMGDVGYVDADGFLYLTDRKAYLIISGGVNVYPQEAENVLITHDKVMDAAVFGVPNPDFGEEVKAVVQPIAMPVGGEEEEALSRELIAFCRSQLSDIKCPRSIDFREQLPRDPSGKLHKRLLKDEYWAEEGKAAPK
jgi:acyl-CoA synthetase (AMP-forming)/AMP-acid ligase II